MKLKVRKRVLVAIFHIIVVSAYLVMWMVKWSAIEPIVISSTVNKSVSHNSTWRTPMADYIEKFVLMGYKDQECCSISIYDNIFHDVCDELNTDWRLMSAIAYAESRFKPHVISSGGAIGLMQIMPQTARIHGVTLEAVAEPKVNIRVASLHYNLIDYMLDTPENTPIHDRISLNLACYNGGIGRVFDAQRLARHNGENPYSWSSISKQLVKLLEPEYYELDIIKNGRFNTARQTIAYVNSVLYRYDLYCVQTQNCTHTLAPITSDHRF